MATATEPEVITLDAAAARRLVERSALSPSAASPLSTVLRGGGTGAPAPTESDLALFRESIEVAAQPQAYVRILILKPDAEEEETIGLLAREGRGVSFSLRDDALHIGRAQPLTALVASLAPALTHEGPLAGNEAWLWPSVAQLLTGLWQDDPDPARPLSRAAVVERLRTPEFGQAEAEKFVQGVVGSGAVRQEGDVLSIDAGLRPWLALLWSGHAAQVEYFPLSPDTPLDEALNGPHEHLLFMGPAPQRIRNQAVTGDALAAHLGGRKGREASMLHLSAPPAEDVARALRALLKIETA